MTMPAFLATPDGAPIPGVILASIALEVIRRGPKLPVMPVSLDKPIRRLPARDTVLTDLVVALDDGDVDGAVDAVLTAAGVWSPVLSTEARS